MTPAPLPVVAIVGRPNVGKSTLFNRIAGRRQALVHDLPGITRDRVTAEVDLGPGRATIVDTGGFDTTADDVIRRGIREQVERAVREGDVLLFVVDCRTGPSAQDEEIATWLRKSGKPVVLVGNKADVPGLDVQARMVSDLHRLGFADVFPVSAEHRHGVDELLERVVALLPARDEASPAAAAGAPPIKVAIVGRPNVGKSSLANALLGDERCLVTEVAGTTRDAVDVLYESASGQRYLFIDTAGIRKKGKVDTAPEILSVVMARKAIARCDVALLVADASEPISHQDAVVAGYAYEAGRGVAILLNKWDLLRGAPERQEKTLEDVRMGMKFLDFAPVLKVSARTGAGLSRVLPTVSKVYASATKRLTTGVLNRFSADVVQAHAPGAGLDSDVRIYYLTQTGTLPPLFTLFTNAAGRKLHFSFVRFLENRLREHFGFVGTPIRLKVVARGRRGKLVGRSRVFTP